MCTWVVAAVRVSRLSSRWEQVTLRFLRLPFQSLQTFLLSSGSPLKSLRRLTGDNSFRGARGEITNYTWSLLTSLISSLYRWISLIWSRKPRPSQIRHLSLCYSNIPAWLQHFSQTVKYHPDGHGFLWLQEKFDLWLWITAFLAPTLVHNTKWAAHATG